MTQNDGHITAPVAVFEAKCGLCRKGRRYLRVKNHLRLEEFTVDDPILEQGKTYKITIEEVTDGK